MEQRNPNNDKSPVAIPVTNDDDYLDALHTLAYKEYDHEYESVARAMYEEMVKNDVNASRRAFEFFALGYIAACGSVIDGTLGFKIIKKD